jgi:aspartyl-tRNA(Asn)/glutamyl-tRNA(Gln) amidotransferase subunit C
MSAISDEEVLNLAKLSGLELSEKELPEFKEYLETVLEYVDKLQALDLSDYEPTYQVTGLTNVFREDEVEEPKISRDELVKNIKTFKDGYIEVPRIIE